MQKGKRTLAERERLFMISLEAYKPIYGERMISDFFSYWTEANEGARKMRFEKEKTWCLDRRLKRWFLNSGKYGNASKTLEQRMNEYGAVASDFRNRQK